MTRNRLYLLLGAGIAAGYIWLAWAYHQVQSHAEFTPCIFKNTTGIACPSCGSTRSVLLLSKGHLTDALLLNPLGFITAAIMVIVPFWLLYDIARKEDTLYRSYKKSEIFLRKKWVAVTLIILIIINWLWNIQKGL